MSASRFTHSFNFDPGYNMDLAQLLAVEVPQPPSDFADFWRQRYTATLAVLPRANISPVTSQYPHHVAYELHYTSTDDVEIGGWLLAPVHGRVCRGVVMGHGYGGCEPPENLLPVNDAVLLFPCFRGLGCSPVMNVSPNPCFHVLHNIQDRQRYILGGCVEDLWMAVSALLELFPQAVGHVAYSGISFGGGIGALAVPWDPRVGRLHLHVPTFGHQALRLTLQSVGSAESVRHFQGPPGFHLMDTLSYYDAASAATYLQIPVFLAAALFDPVVPPPGQFAVFNAIPGPLKRLFVLQSGHFDEASQAQQLQEMHREVAKFFMEP